LTSSYVAVLAAIIIIGMIFAVTDTMQQQKLLHTMSRPSPLAATIVAKLVVTLSAVTVLPILLHEQTWMAVPWNILHGYLKVPRSLLSMEPMFTFCLSRRISMKPWKFVQFSCLKLF